MVAVSRLTKVYITEPQMKRKILLSSLALLAAAILCKAQNIEYHDAAQFPAYGTVAKSPKTRYERFPSSFEGRLRAPLWYLGRNSAGAYVRFRTDSPTIKVKWTSLFGNSMSHMAATGVRGLDLYTLYDGAWKFAGVARPSGEKESEYRIIGAMDGQMREYMLYLSLYDGVGKLEIGVEKGSTIEATAINSPSTEKPLVFYGTSIMQGGCVSRPGMLATSIISRKLDKESFNFGFSGNALLDLQVAELMASVPDPGVFILDYAPNASAKQISEIAEKFFRILRNSHPEVPCIFVEDPQYAHCYLDSTIRAEVTRKNMAQKEVYDRLVAKGEKGLFYIKSETILGDDNEATVDCIHSTDLGAVRYVDALLPTIQKALKTKVKANISKNYDVTVIGGSASGTAAAIQAARSGAKVLLVEETGWLGGMLTSAGVSATDGCQNLRGGFWAEFRDSLETWYGGAAALNTGWVSSTLFEPSVGNRIFTTIAAGEPNLTVCFNTTANSFKKTSSGWSLTLNSVGKENSDGKGNSDSKGFSGSKISTKVLIDATELGDVARETGVPYRTGKESKAETGEPAAPDKHLDIVQDITYVVTLKEYDHPVTIPEPDGYNADEFACCCANPLCKGTAKWTAVDMMNYGKLPNGKYMINWPIHGNDYYSAGIIEAAPEERAAELEKAKKKSLRFLYFIQNELGYTNIGIADDEYPTADGLPMYPYYRESRRIVGKVFFTANDIFEPFAQDYPLYRTAIASGDYPIDQHHNEYSGPETFQKPPYVPANSYGLPIGVMFPEDDQNLIVAEKSISVSNLANGTTRLQPVVLQLGQAAGVVAALAVKNGCKPSEVSVREVQKELLEDNVYLLPLLDAVPGDPHFAAYQRIALTGILKYRGVKDGWQNKSYLDIDRPMMMKDLLEGLKNFYGEIPLSAGECESVTVENLANLIAIGSSQGIVTGSDSAKSNNIQSSTAQSSSFKDTLLKTLSSAFGKNYGLDTALTRGETAVALDSILKPFDSEVDIYGRIVKQQNR